MEYSIRCCNHHHVCCFFALSWKALKQFEDTDYLFVYFVLIFVALRFGIGVGLDALTDPLQEQQTPFLYGVGIFIYGSKLVDAAPTVLIQYALIVYLISLLAAGLMEAIYSGLSKFIPRRISKYLNGFDAKLDKTLRNLSDDHFAITNRGFWVGLVGFIGLGVVTYFIITSV